MSYTGSCRFATAQSRIVATGLATILILACGGGAGGPGPNPDNETLAKANPSGDLQAGLPGQQLPDPLRVVVRRGTVAVAGKTVTWQPSAGQVNPTSSTTGSDGVATTTVTLPQGGEMTIQANASGVSGGPVTFTAAAASNAATVQVQGPPSNQFSPQVVAVRAGGSVTFDWPPSAREHNIIPDDGRSIPSSPTVRDGPFTVTVVFPTVGEYFYHCGVHGSTRSGMFGRVVVLP